MPVNLTVLALSMGMAPLLDINIDTRRYDLATDEVMSCVDFPMSMVSLERQQNDGGM